MFVSSAVHEEHILVFPRGINKMILYYFILKWVVLLQALMSILTCAIQSNNIRDSSLVMMVHHQNISDTLLLDSQLSFDPVVSVTSPTSSFIGKNVCQLCELTSGYVEWGRCSAVYHGDSKCWELPLFCLSRLN